MRSYYFKGNNCGKVIKFPIAEWLADKDKTSYQIKEFIENSNYGTQNPIKQAIKNVHYFDNEVVIKKIIFNHFSITGIW